jgi:FtsP/CotA-like multicopper oxidase with cupredoxin domain
LTTRRAFLGQATATLALSGLARPAFAASHDPQALVAREAVVQLAPEGYPATSIWGYDGTLPGTLIRVRQGERIRRRLVNELPQPSSVHWHGLRIENAMDGVAGLTQDPVPPGESFDYDFVAPDAGTFWYHSHYNSVEQVARGLYGALIVDEAEPVDVDHDEILMLDDWLLDTETAQLDPDFAAPHSLSHAGRRGNFVATNGAALTELPVKPNERIRLRLINAANARIFPLTLSGLDGWVMAYDGMPLDTPEKLEGEFLLGPGQRVDLFVDVTAAAGESAHLVRLNDEEGFSQVAFPVAGDGVSRTRRDAPAALPPNPGMDVPGVEGAPVTDLLMEGGAMGGLQEAVYNGETLGFRALVDANQFWAFNGVVGMTDTPLMNVARGETARVKMRNETAFPHAMHLHGMHFREVLENGDLGPLRDTLLVFRGETREIAFVGGAPGKWLFHCHMLGHTASGMATWVQVT